MTYVTTLQGEGRNRRGYPGRGTRTQQIFISKLMIFKDDKSETVLYFYIQSKY